MTLSKDRIVLLAAPHAGGSSALFRAWPPLLPDWIELVPLHLPGRGAKHALRPVHDWQRLIEGLSEDVAPKLDKSFAIFGHSMGALVGLELAHALRARRGVEPLCFFASACSPPSPRTGENDWLSCSRERFVEKLRALGGTPDEVLQDAGLLDVLLPMLRADFHLSDTYRPRNRAPLRTPIIAFGGSDDASAPVDTLGGWSAQTCREARVELFAGGHFFLDAHGASVVASLVSALERARAGMQGVGAGFPTAASPFAGR